MEIKKKVEEFFEVNYGLGSLDPDEDLFELGLVDSMALVIMVAYFEKEFDVTIYRDDITTQSFGTINKIICGLEKKIHQQ